MPKKKTSEIRILSLILSHGSLSASELARITGYSRSWVWKTLRQLEAENALRLEKRGGTLIAHPAEKTYKKLIRIGILRASEYPYIIPFAKRLRERFNEVEILVYDEAFELAYDIALGKVHLGMAPAISHLIVHRVSGGLSYIFAGGSSGGAGIVMGENGVGHATTMASTMEVCAEIKRLPPPRLYYRRGWDIVESVLQGKVAMGVVWQPYLYLAERRGLRIEPCNLPFCCLLGGNASLRGEQEVIAKLFSEAVEEARRRLQDSVFIESYAKLIGLDPELVKATVTSYEFLEEPPVEDLSRLLRVLKDVAFPAWILDQAIL